MVNERFLELARRWGNPSLPIERETVPQAPQTNQAPGQNTNFPDLPSESFLLSYDHSQHGEFFKELISKVNTNYQGTKAEISQTNGEVQGNIIKRMGIISTIANQTAY